MRARLRLHRAEPCAQALGWYLKPATDMAVATSGSATPILGSRLLVREALENFW